MAEKHTLWPTSSEGSRALEDDPIRRLAAMAGGGGESVCEKRKFRAQKAFYFSSNFQRILAAAQLHQPESAPATSAAATTPPRALLRRA